MSDLVERAREAGEDHGRSAGTWHDSFVSDGEARLCLVMDEDGDPQWWDCWDPGSPLSGEWADDPTPRSVLAGLDTDEDDPDADEALTAYEDGYRDAFREHVIAAARRYLDA
jgi:hypothetical protein